MSPYTDARLAQLDVDAARRTRALWGEPHRDHHTALTAINLFGVPRREPLLPAPAKKSALRRGLEYLRALYDSWRNGL